MKYLNFDNVSTTTADLSLNSVVRLAIREGFIDLVSPNSITAPDTAIATLGDLKTAGGYMFQRVEHNGPVETIPQGCILANGQKVYDSSFPVQIAKVRGGHQFAVSELLWQQGVTGNPDAYKGCWSLGGTDEYGAWVRPPKLNRDGNYRAPFLRGSEVGVDAGKLALDQMQGHRHVVWVNHLTTSNEALTVTHSGTPNTVANVNFAANVNMTAGTVITDGVNGTPRIGAETAPRYHGVIMCIRMFGVVSNPGSLDAAQLATDLGVVSSILSTKASIKVGQVNVSTTRQPNVLYTNSSTNQWLPISVLGTATGGSQAIVIAVGLRRHINLSVAAGNMISLSALVPPGATWTYTAVGLTGVEVLEGA